MILPPISVLRILLFEAGGWPGQITLILTLLLSLAGNMVQYKRGQQADVHETEQRRLEAVDGLLRTRTEQLEEITRKFDKIEVEYRTLVGLDVQMLLDFAKEGLTVAVVNLERQLRTRGVLAPPPGEKDQT